MLLADKIGEIRDQSLTALDASHDFYSHTKNVWRMIQRMVEQGRQIAFRNLETQNVIDEQSIPEIAQYYVSGYLATATFQQFVSQFETFILELLRVWLTEYPQSLFRRTVTLQEIINSSDKAEMIDKIVEKKLLELAYKRLSDWFEYLDDLMNISGPGSKKIALLSEIKASRDVLVHNNGIVNDIYMAKSGASARFRPGEKLELPEFYHRSSWLLIKEIVQNISDEVIKKLPK